jgi:hypothetical protein
MQRFPPLRYELDLHLYRARLWLGYVTRRGFFFNFGLFLIIFLRNEPG